MQLHSLLSILMLLAAAAYLALGIYLMVTRRAMGRAPVGLLFVPISIWVLGGAVEQFATSYTVFSIGRVCHFVGTALLPVAAYVSFREYTGRRTSLRRLVLLLIVPAVSVTLAATNAYHEFMWRLPATNPAGEFLTRPDSWGLWFLFVHAPYSYALIGMAMLTLLTHSSAVSPAHRRHLMLLVAACIGPLIAIAAYDFGLGPNTISTLPVVFVLMLPIYGWLALGEQWGEYTPLAYETVFQNMQDPVVVVDEQGRIIALNHGAENLLDVTETSALLAPLGQFLECGSDEVFDALNTGMPRKMMTGTGRFLHVQVSPISSDVQAAKDGRVLMFRDVSDVEKAQAEVRASEKMLRALIDHSVNGIIRLRWLQTDADEQRQLRCIFANAAAERFLGVGNGELTDRQAMPVLALACNDMDTARQRQLTEWFEHAAIRSGAGDIEVRHRSHGATRWLRLMCERFGADVALTLVDITDGKEKEQQMESMALSDPLTGILNRRGFEQAATQRLAESPDDATGALLFIDLNDFKKINDGSGHEAGDLILTVAARRLQTSLRSCDIIGRLGGDEFVALVPDVTATVADELAKRLTQSLEEPYRIGKDSLSCAASIGLALYPEHARTLTGLMRAADQAMYRAKARCRGAGDVRPVDLLERAL